MKINEGWKKVQGLIEMRTMIATWAISLVAVAQVSQVILADVYNSKEHLSLKIISRDWEMI